MSGKFVETRLLFVAVVSLVALMCFFPARLRADSITVTVDGTQYDVTTVTTSFAADSQQLESNPWWGNQTLALAIATAVADDIGTPNNGGDGGPLVAYSGDSVNAYLFVEGNVGSVTVPNTSSDTWMVVAPFTAPEPSSVALMLVGLGFVFVLWKLR